MAIVRAEAGIKSVSCAHDQHAVCSGEAMYGDARPGHELDLIVSPCICFCHDEAEQERWHLEIEDDVGKPFISGCDCDLQRDHYAWPEPFRRLGH